MGGKGEKKREELVSFLSQAAKKGKKKGLAIHQHDRKKDNRASGLIS